MLPTPGRLLALAAGIALALPLLPSPAATATSPVSTAAGVARASAAGPISLWAPSRTTAYSYDGRAWTDLGLRVVAQGAPFEVWASRPPSYDRRIVASWRSGARSGRLPARAMPGFSGLARFLDLAVDPDREGAATFHLSRSACLNGWSERVRPEAPARSPYPQGCWYNPYTLGSVQGVQDGWATPVLQNSRPLRLDPGTYTVTATVRPMYAEALGLSPEEATRTTRLTVLEEASDRGTSRRPASSPARPAAAPPTGAPAVDPTGPVPDLRSLPAWGISLNKAGTLLRFSATVWNAGDSPLVVDGFREEGQDEMAAYQYFFDAAGNQTGYRPVGHLHWDQRRSHQHWHFQDFARYSLLGADRAEVARSKKEAFCLANTDAVDLTVPDAEWRPENTDLSTSCGDYSSLSIREVLAAGWGDTYTQARAGQSFRIGSLPNGVYYIAVNANPSQRLVEASLGNNLSVRRIRLAGTPANRRVVVAQVGVISEEGYGGMG